MESDHVSKAEIIAFFKNVIVDLKINYAEGQGEISLLLEKCQSMDLNNMDDIEELLKELRDASIRKGYRDGVMKISEDFLKLIS